MKCLGVLAIFAVVAIVCSSAAEVSESDVVRVFDPNLKLTTKAMLKILEKAKLEKAGFKKTVESTIETDENGEKRVKNTIHYMIKDDCAKAGFWEGVLEQRLPKNFFSSKVGSTFVREIQSRIKGRGTKYCKIGLEIHPNRCLSDSSATSGLTKRSVRAWCGWSCGVCFAAKVVY